MTSHLSDVGSTRSHDLLMPSTRFDYMSKSTTNIDTLLLYVEGIDRKGFVSSRSSGLNEEEVAFYDALADNESARQVMQDETLKLIARELSDRIKSKATLDWTKRETVRADMRRTIRRLLTKYGYPPDAQESATQLVIRQAELMAESIVS